MECIDCKYWHDDCLDPSTYTVGDVIVCRHDNKELSSKVQMAKADTIDSLRTALQEKEKDFERMKKARDRDFQQAMENGNSAIELKAQLEKAEKVIKYYAEGNYTFTQMLNDDSVKPEIAQQYMKEKGDG